MRLALASLLLLAGAPVVAGAAGSLYRWVDAKGQVHYTQTPPRDGNFREVTPRLPPAPARAAVTAPKATNVAAAAVPSPASVAESNKKTAEYNATIKAQNCKNNQARVAQVQAQGAASALRQQADGSVVPYGPDDYKRDLAEAQKAVADTCGK